MSISWKLKQYASRKYGVYRAVDLQKIIVDKTGVLISLQQVCNLLNKRPVSLKLTTVEVVCTALECNLSDICEVTSSSKRKSKSVKKLSYKNTPHNKRGVKKFPNPDDYHSL